MGRRFRFIGFLPKERRLTLCHEKVKEWIKDIIAEISLFYIQKPQVFEYKKVVS
jgi:hypothetical protein